MGGGKSSSPSSTTTTTEPWSGAKPYLTDIMAKAQNAYNTMNKESYSGDLYAKPNANQTSANSALLSLVQDPSFLAATKAANENVIKTASGDYIDPSKNTALQGAIEATNRPIIQSFQESVIPGLNSAAIAGGAYGGARNGLALGRASQGLADTLADKDAQIVYQNYATERGYQNQAPQFLQILQNAFATPALTQGNVGSMEQGWAQNAINAAISKYNTEQMEPWAGLSEYASLIQNPGGTSTTQAANSSNGFTNALQGALGGGMLGAGAMSAFPETMAALGMTGPWGIAAGAGLGLLGGLFS